MPLNDNLPETGFVKLDNATSRRPKTLINVPLLKDPTYGQDKFYYNRVLTWGANVAPGSELSVLASRNYKFEEIEEAYDSDTYVQQGIDKYVELTTKHGWVLDGEDREPIDYLYRRFLIMGLMTGKCFELLIAYLVRDFIMYGNSFIVKKRGKSPEGLDGMPDSGAGANNLPILGYFRADPKRMVPRWSKDGRYLVGWDLRPKNGKVISFKLNDVVHFSYNPKPGDIWGMPPLMAALDDVRAYRQVEEYVMRLLYKFLNPLIHHEVPGADDMGIGRQEDIEVALLSHQIMAPDGIIVTPPNHKINVIGAESKALRGEAYLKVIRQRVFSGIGVNDVVMGEASTTSQGTADVMTASMHNRAKYFQKQLAEMLTEYVVYELLLEGGFDPTQPLIRVKWLWNEIETETLIKRENHAMQLWTNGVLTLDETRRAIGKKPMSEEDEKNTYPFKVKIPVVLAQGEALAMRLAATADGPAKQVDSRDRPSNQHGNRGAPKIRPK